ncbi:biotin transport system substrate-specific component [Agromyces hippuratus]|uniref:Biotin transport system substrate-specific component n=1 Tax=Agromyces hippuratus TaxID=286438 RepID=A0A852X2V1_9MICO|nr:biotin transporter BioY [Agromyces hippuratus]NYG20431.1 biotin transport system substrate-specific component [Agromyces hippuratus]
MSSAHSTSQSTSPDTTESGPTASGARPRRSSARDLAQIAVFAALIAALGLPGALTIGGTAVPITFQTLGVMLAGAILGARKGTLSVLLFIALVAAGLPLLSGGRGGLGVFVGPSVGYLIGWLLGAAVIGWATARLLPRYPVVPALAWTALGGIVAIYLVGVPVFAAITGTPLGLAISGSAVFLPGDLLKVVVTVFVAKGVHRAWPGLIEPRSWPWAPRPGAVVADPASDSASDSTAADRSA